jgi:hypothetical protein
MLKKSLIFGTVALFLAALIAFTGCEQATDSESSSSVGGRHSVWGSVNPFELQDVIDLAIADGEPITLEDGLKIVGQTEGAAWVNTVDFKNANVRINGAVAVEGVKVHFNAARATVTFAGSLYTRGGDYIVRENTSLASLPVNVNVEGGPNGFVVEYGRLDSAMLTSTRIAVDKYTYGQISGYDYSSGAPVAPNSIIDTIYVLDTVALPDIIGAPDTLGVIAFGAVDVIASGEDGIINQVLGSKKLKLGSSSTLTSSTGYATINIPVDGQIPNIKVQEKPIAININGTPVNFKVNKLLGPGTLTVNGNFDEDIFIGGGDGNVTFPGTLALKPNKGVQIGSTGLTVFDNALTLTANSKIAGNVVFKANVSTNSNLSLGGDVTLYNGTTTTLSVAANTLTLAKGKNILVGGGKYTGTNAGIIEPVPVLAAGDDASLVLKMAASSALITNPAPSATANDERKAEAYRITFNGNVAVKRGTLVVKKYLGVLAASVITTTNIKSGNDYDIIGGLDLVDGASLALFGGNAGNGGKINLGFAPDGTTPITSIAAPSAGTAASVLTASGGTVTLKANSITSPVAATLTAGTTTVATFATTETLALDRVTLDINRSGILTVTGAQKGIKLDNGAGLLFRAEGAADERKTIQNAGFRADIIGAATVSAAGNNLASVIHNGSADSALIRSRQADPVSLSRSGTSLVQ